MWWHITLYQSRIGSGNYKSGLANPNIIQPINAIGLLYTSFNITRFALRNRLNKSTILVLLILNAISLNDKEQDFVFFSNLYPWSKQNNRSFFPENGEKLFFYSINTTIKKSPILTNRNNLVNVLQ